MSMFNLFSSKKRDPDQEVISQLIKAGSNISKPHKIDFFLYFSDPLNAETAKEEIGKIYTDAEVTVEESNGGRSFLCHVKKIMVPEVGALKALRRNLEELAQKFNGEYDGWGAAVSQ